MTILVVAVLFQVTTFCALAAPAGWCGDLGSSGLCGAQPVSFLNSSQYQDGTAQSGPFLINYGGSHHTHDQSSFPLIFDFLSGTWFSNLETRGVQPGPRQKNVLAVTEDGRVFTIGGASVSDNALYQLDLQTYTWSGLTTSGHAPLVSGKAFADGALTRQGWICGVHSPSWGILVALRNYLLLVYLTSDTETAYTAGGCHSAAHQLDLSTLVWSNHTGADGCSCYSTAVSCSGCFSWLRATNHAALGDMLYVLRDDAMFAYNAVAVAWSKVNAALGCCGVPSGVDASRVTHYVRMTAVAGDNTESKLWIFTDDVIYAYSPTSHSMVVQESCYDGRCARIIDGTSTTRACEAASSDGWNYTSFEALPFPLSAHRAADATYDNFYMYPYRFNELGVRSAFGSFEDLSWPKLAGVVPQLAHFGQELMPLKHQALALRDQAYIIGCSASSSAEPELYAYDTVAASFAALGSLPASLCTSADGFTAAADPVKGKLNVLWRPSNTACEMWVYDVASATWASSTLEGADAATVCCRGASLASGNGVVYAYGGCTPEDSSAAVCSDVAVPACESLGLATIAQTEGLYYVSRKVVESKSNRRSLAGLAVVGSRVYTHGGVLTASGAVASMALQFVDVDGSAWELLSHVAVPSMMTMRACPHLLAHGENLLTVGTAYNSTSAAHLAFYISLGEGASSWREIHLSEVAQSNHVAPHRAAFTMLQSGLILALTNTAAGNPGLYSLQPFKQTSWDADLAPLLGTRLRLASEYEVLKLPAGAYLLSRAIQLDRGAAAHLALLGEGSSVTSLSVVGGEGTAIELEGVQGVAISGLTLQDCRGPAEGGAMRISSYTASDSCPALTDVSFVNVSARQGGAVYMAAVPCNMSFSAVRFLHCTAVGTSGEGGAVYMDEASAHFSSSTFQRNSAASAAGVLLASSNATFIGTDFTENKAAHGGGGAVAAFLSDWAAEDCVFTANAAAGDGGAVNVALGGGSGGVGGGHTSLRRCTFSSNSAQQDGGAVASRQTDVSIEECAFTGNAAGDYGGAIDVSEPLGAKALVLSSSAFTGNVAAAGTGGALAIRNSRATESSMHSITDSSFSENSALSGGGYSLLHLFGAHVDVSGCAFSANSAEKWGGAVHVDRTCLTANGTNAALEHSVESTRMVSNTADVAGGAIFFPLVCGGISCAGVAAINVTCRGAAWPSPGEVRSCRHCQKLPPRRLEE
ncbi:hypothetical protein CYMTET_38522 [Cymbomonas tetramitiformis]|uniref:Uncharacterized protein n=1 Tax=Cymbomonas tetramitiformis TaxID=36881 RepID=A0AAE0CDM0_9CHLO|nr:hypothetical protein CYMTET_38522 [Cymbomonas tetramitiformis]